MIKISDFNLSRLDTSSRASSIAAMNPRWLVHWCAGCALVRRQAGWRNVAACPPCACPADGSWCAHAARPLPQAPEVMRGEGASKASDVFAYGVVLWELLTLEFPWSAANPWQIVSIVLGGGRLEIPPRERLPGADTRTFAGLDAFVSLIKACWAQNHLDRPSFQEIIARLRWGRGRIRATKCMAAVSDTVPLKLSPPLLAAGSSVTPQALHPPNRLRGLPALPACRGRLVLRCPPTLRPSHDVMCEQAPLSLHEAVIAFLKVAWLHGSCT